ncbi:hypothetical protein POL68_27190 [Stigmatella sp. ncwal1]|uniref:Serine protease n=2 Tax=Stigmatella ashevillensis TaxID=2995309 RepID=A0ABT5DET5_9BACT|nr:hypothetical protein [Stigmatella ashevillena]
MSTVGCADDIRTPESATANRDKNGAEAGEHSSGPALTIDEEFTRMAREVPGFGGYYYDETGTLNVVLTHPSAQLDAARALLRMRQVRGSNAVVVKQGQYGFEELNRWRALLEQEAKPGWVFTDVDEVRNRVAVGVSRASRAELMAALSRLQIPAAAVLVEDAEPVQEQRAAYSHLHQWNRPLAGGLYVYTGVFCTLGFNVRREGKLGFFTNTHCARLNTTHWQGIWDSDRIGVTTEDPPFWSDRTDVYNGLSYVCPSNKYCRFSDASYAVYDDAVQSQVKFGYIFRTQLENAYTGGEPIGVAQLKIDEAHPFFRIVGKAYNVAAGETIHKMGQRTGWTSGKVNKTCANSYNGNTWLFCQMWGGGAGYSGDSGSPVFRRVPGTDADVELVGMYWGSGMSPIGSIEKDFGTTLDVVADEVGNPAF